jgi:hypothetical protein
MQNTKGNIFDKLDDNGKPLMNTEELAAAIGSSPGTIRIHRCHNTGPFGIREPIPFIKLGNRVLYQTEVVKKYFQDKAEVHSNISECVAKK